jgi:integrase
VPSLPRPVFHSSRLLDQVRERARYLHYSQRTEDAYVYWVRFFIRWQGVRHPRDMGAPEVQAFLTMLANERRASSSTHNQALSALLFLYREVLGVSLPWLDDIGRPKYVRRIPVVLTPAEVSRLIAVMDDEVVRLLVRLLYGAGMRLMEALRLRVKDVDFERHVIVVREGKGNKDRVVMLPRSVAPDLRHQVSAARLIWDQDRAPKSWAPDKTAAPAAAPPGLQSPRSCTAPCRKAACRRPGSRRFARRAWPGNAESSGRPPSPR